MAPHHPNGREFAKLAHHLRQKIATGKSSVHVGILMMLQKNILIPEEVLSPRDVNGHGTHTASTAGGNIVHNVSFLEQAVGTARGGAPRARLAIYKPCWTTTQGTGCSGAGLLKAMYDAVHDGVDILSLSIGGPIEDPGTLHVVVNGSLLCTLLGTMDP